MQEVRPFIGGTWVDGCDSEPLTDKYTGEQIASVQVVSPEQVAMATRGVAEAQSREMPSNYERYQILATASRLLDGRRHEFVEAMVADTGFTTADARADVDRTVQTLQLSAEEAKRVSGEMVPLHGAPTDRGRLGFTVRHPLGVVAAITPFNSPLNTVAHKVGPAIAAGNGVVLKPSGYTPLSADLLLRLLLDAGAPAELLSVIYGSGSSVGSWLLEDPVPAFYAFTGSSEVGEHIRRVTGLRRCQLELGSIASTVICGDANVENALPVCLSAAFRKAGQVCTSTQRLYVHKSVLTEVLERLTEELAHRKAGDPRDPNTFIGPLIDPGAADRVENWLERAVARGARIVSGGGRKGPVIEPTVLTEVAPEMDVMCKEVFGPVISVRPFDDFDAALDEINDTPYGLSAGIFTADIAKALTAAQRLRMGAIHINAASSNRVDLMPYTGAKRSGLGKEGPHYAVQEMTEERLITIGTP